MQTYFRSCLLFILLFLGAYVLHAQEIKGRVLDDKKEPMISATVLVFQNGIQKGGAVTDFDGYYVLKPLAPGYYSILVIYMGYDSARNDVLLQGKEIAEVNFELKRGIKYLPRYERRNCGIISWEPKPTILTKEEINGVVTVSNERVLVRKEIIVCPIYQCRYVDPPGRKTLFYSEISTMP